MTTFSDFGGPLRSDEAAREDRLVVRDGVCERERSMRILEEIASTLRVPVDAFFAADAPVEAAEPASAQEVADLIRAFLAITDPVKRRYCLDLVRAAGGEGRGRPA